jgi:hypothetical protein
MTKLPENTRNNNYEEAWFNNLTPAQRQFWYWMITSDGKKRSTARDYVNYVGECSAYLGPLLGIDADFYSMDSPRQIAQLKELLYSNPIFQKHSAVLPALKSALNKFTLYMEKKNNSKTHITMLTRKEAFKEWMLANDYKENTAINYASNVQKCSDFMTERIEKYDFYRAQSLEELNQKAIRLLKDVSFKDMDIALHAQCSNALKRYCEFMASL